MKNQGISIIISARNEMPNLPHTINSLMLDMEGSSIKKYEFIVADNGSTDDTTRFFTYAWANAYAKRSGTQFKKELGYRRRGLVTEGRLRFCHDPVFSNVGARHKAVPYARYENIIFADGHISVKHGTIKSVIETLDKHGGIVHVPVAWTGASYDKPSAGTQYTYKIGEKIWGTWTRYMIADTPFFIPLSGHCFFAVKKKEYLDFGGYDTHQQIYGGGENYLDTLYWMLGSNVMCDPGGLVFHLSAGRGYAYNADSLIHNMILTAYTLGGMKWAERIYITYLNKKGVDKQFLKEIFDSAIKHGQEKRDFIASRQKMTIDELLCIGKENDCDGHCYKNQAHSMRIWDKKNEELHGKHLSFVVVYDEWLTRLTDPDAIKLFKESPHQK